MNSETLCCSKNCYQCILLIPLVVKTFLVSSPCSGKLCMKKFYKWFFFFNWLTVSQWYMKRGKATRQDRLNHPNATALKLHFNTFWEIAVLQVIIQLCGVVCVLSGCNMKRARSLFYHHWKGWVYILRQVTPFNFWVWPLCLDKCTSFLLGK